MTADPNIVAAYRRGLARAAGRQQVTFMRPTGVAPNKAFFSATVIAVVQDYAPDSTSEAETDVSGRKLGAITQGDRTLIVMADDLAAQNFPLPLVKNDKVELASGDQLNVVSVDAYKRQAAGAIEVKASGTA